MAGGAREQHSGGRRRALPVVPSVRRVLQLEHAIGHQGHAEARGAGGVHRVVHVGAQRWGQGGQGGRARGGGGGASVLGSGGEGETRRNGGQLLGERIVQCTRASMPSAAEPSAGAGRAGGVSPCAQAGAPWLRRGGAECRMPGPFVEGGPGLL